MVEQDGAAAGGVTDVAEIPLPEGDALEAMLAEETAKVERSAPKPEVAALAFTGKRERSRTVPLEFPFELDGKLVESVTVRRLTGYEVSEVAGVIVREDGGFDRFDLYAAMTGLPASVMRGLDQDDGLAVLSACRDFLPRVMSDGG